MGMELVPETQNTFTSWRGCLSEKITLDISNWWARGYCYQIWCMLVGHFRTFSKAASVCITSCCLHRILVTNWNITASKVFAFIRFLFQSTGRGRIRFADGGVRFPRSGLFGSSASGWDGSTPRHADTLPHRRKCDFRVSHSSECFNTEQYTKCALARVLREKQRRNISLNYAVVLDELVAQNCHWIQNIPIPAGARYLHANINIQTGSGAHSVSYSMDTSIISQG